jgi:RNA polymerase sigma factor (sigma-70 family)
MIDDDSVALLDRYRSGEAEAAERLYERFVERLVNLARQNLSPRLARRIDPEDVVQSAYRSFFVHARAGEYTVTQSGELWKLLAKIAMHKLLRQAEFHTAAKRSIEREAGLPGEPRPEVVDLATREPSPEQVVALADEMEDLLRPLRLDDRRVVELRLASHTIDEITATTGRPVRTVRRVLARFRQELARRSTEPSHSERPGPVSSPRANEDCREHRAKRRRIDPEAPLDYDDFRIKRLIGSGGMGKVYAAVQKSLGKPVAIKALRKAWLADRRAIERFVGEARTAARLRHPNVVDVHGVGRLPAGGYFMVMDLVEGHDLANVVQRALPSLIDAAAIVATVAETIEHAHLQGVVHCDLKPGNVLVDRHGRIFVTDFGLARSIGSESARHDPTASASSSCLGGTAAFMAPEQIDAAFGRIGPATDVHGLGGILYVLLVGHAPFEGASLRDVLGRVTSALMPPAPHALRPEVPDWLSEV